MTTPAIVFGDINRVTKEPHWQEFSFANWSDIPSKWLYRPVVIYQRSQDGTIAVMKHRLRTDWDKLTEEQLRQDLIDFAAHQNTNPDQLSLPFSDDLSSKYLFGMALILCQRRILPGCNNETKKA